MAPIGNSVFQNFDLPARTGALKNVEPPLIYAGTPAARRRRKALACLEAAGPADRAGHRSSRFSGGPQQRVAIARALVNQPPTLLAGGPTGALNTHTGIEVMAVLQRLNRELGIALIPVAHKAGIAAFAGRTLRFRDGRPILDQPNRNPRIAEREMGGNREVAA